MAGTRHKRLHRIRHAIDSSPVRRDVLREAYECFAEFGELPDDDHVAFEVVQQALRGGEEEPLQDDAVVADQVRKARLAYHQRERPGDAWPPSVRALLFDEALFEPAPLRNLARALIAFEVAWGGDVENQGFAARHGIPCYGSIAMHISGWPKRLAVAPYEHVARRLFTRLDNVRGNIPDPSKAWFEQQNKALIAFVATGALDPDDLQLESVLVNYGLDLLHDHQHGKDVAEVLALVDETGRREGEELEVVLQKLSAAVKLQHG